MKTALVAGSTGLTGTVLKKLLRSDTKYHQVFLAVRQVQSVNDGKFFEHKTNYDKLFDSLSSIKGVDDVYCCLGTTMRKAGSREAFRKVDYEYPIALAKWSESQGVKRFLCISALGADLSSKIFYNRVKGEMERDISKMKIPSITFFRPSLILGEREERRPMEKAGMVLANSLSFLFVGPLKKYKAIPVERLAAAMIKAAHDSSTGVRVVESMEMNK